MQDARSSIPLRSTPNRTFHKPDLLAPAGNWECAKAAIENGADAIYFGLDRFNARMRAQNFTEADLPELMAWLQGRGVKGYVTVNTLIFTEELPAVERYLHTIIAAGVDAVIVQDIGLCRLIRYLSPDFPIHASTQMTVTSALGVKFAEDLGCELVVLARECSLKEIEKIQQQMAEGGATLPLEVFVHGALCVAYSGQCLTSEALGGRSANRGECAQACRMPYTLIADGEVVDLGDRRYLLSPQDLSGLAVLPDLVRAGVSCLKIEGRLKTPEYVASVTQVYRAAIEAVKQTFECQQPNQQPETDNRQPNDSRRKNGVRDDRDTTIPSNIASSNSVSAKQRYALEMAFSRGLYTGWFQGIDNQALVHARFGKKRGVYLGQVITVNGKQNQVTIEMCQSPLKPGDGVVFDNGHPEMTEEGGRIYAIDNTRQGTVLTFGKQDLNFKRIHGGDRVWKTSDPDLDRQLRQSFAGDTPHFRRPITIEVHGEIGQTLVAIARDERGHIVRVESPMVLEEAQKTPLTPERLQQQFSRLGNTPFFLQHLANHLQGSVIVPVSTLNQMRRAIVTQLQGLREQPRRWTVRSNSSYRDLLPQLDNSPRVSDSARLIVLVRNFEQLEAVLRSGITTLYCEFEDPRRYRDAVQRVKQWREEQTCDGRHDRPAIWVAPPRITKPGETWILQQVRQCDADGYLIRNYDQIQFFAQDCADGKCIGEFSLNVANPITADYLMRTFGLRRLTASYDLNIQQLEALLQQVPSDWLEVTIHQHMPLFHMEHCVFCAFLSEGTDYTNCGRPCESHAVKLRDRVGTDHILQADAGCRNTLFNGVAQTGAEYVQRLLSLGLRHFRLEFLNETAPQVTQTIQAYQHLLRGELTGGQLWQTLKVQSQLGVTRGPLDGRGDRHK